MRPTMARTAGSSSTIRIVPFPVTEGRLASPGGGDNRDIVPTDEWRRGAATLDTSLQEVSGTLNRPVASSTSDQMDGPLEETTMMCLALMTGIAAFVGVKIALR